jgi:hypothetical protein
MLERESVTTPRRWRSTEAVLFLSLLVAGTALTWFRLAPMVRGTVWAEDATIFMAEGQGKGFFAGLLEPYAGYLHVVPRMIIDVATLFPADRYAVMISMLCAMVVGLVAALVGILSGSVLSWMPARVLAALLTVLVPVSAHEILGNAANIHTFFLWLCPWLLLARPRSWWFSILLGVVTLLGALTEIQMLLFLPLVFWGWRNRFGWPIRAGLLLGGAAQLFVTVFWPRGGGGAASSARPLSVFEGYLANGVGTIVQPDGRLLGQFISGYGWLALAGVLCFFVLCAAAVIVWGPGRLKLAACVMLAGSFLSFAIGYVLNPYPGTDYATFTGSELEGGVPLLRYSVASSLLLLGVLPLVVQVLHSRGPKAVPWVATVALVSLSVFSFVPASPFRFDGPAWAPQVAAGRLLCAEPNHEDPVILFAAPSPSWDVKLSCATLGR